MVFSSSLSLNCALKESGCRIGYEPIKMSRDHFWRSISRDTNVEVSASSPYDMMKYIIHNTLFIMNRLMLRLFASVEAYAIYHARYSRENRFLIYLFNF